MADSQTEKVGAGLGNRSRDYSSFASSPIPIETHEEFITQVNIGSQRTVSGVERSKNGIYSRIVPLYSKVHKDDLKEIYGWTPLERYTSRLPSDYRNAYSFYW
jgi:hypothetical protein